MSTRIHHLNCATMSPRLSFGGRVTPARMVAHVLLIEGADGLTLVDSGFGTEDIAKVRMGRPFATLMGAALDTAETAVRQVERLGLDPADVRDIVLTHMDLDHVGGLGDFPTARVHTVAAEHAVATAQRTAKDRGRYLPAQWSHDVQWELHDGGAGEEWHGLKALPATGDDVLLVPLFGHTLGHCGVAVRRPGGGWFLHAGDAYFNHGEMQRPPTCPTGLATFQNIVQSDKVQRFASQDRLRAFVADHGDEVTVFSAHCASEYDALAGVTD